MANKYFYKLIILSLLVLLFFSCNKRQQRIRNVKNNYKDELVNDIWITDKILGSDPEVERYYLTRFKNQKFSGNLTGFYDKINFRSNYVSHCGNDYFTTVFGKYDFFEKNKIGVTVDSVTFHGEWKKQTEHRKDEIIFSITKSGDTIILTKQDK